ncbi:MAG: XTP/dITP diphosphatase [Eubacterium sp.]|nr:XTP/dITP diphosphatase [Eubacterium sp.]
MQKIIFATGNAGKMHEIRNILRETGLQILSMKEAGISADIVEDGTTFEENAIIKAKAVARLLREQTDDTYHDAIVLADDSGLEIDYLNKEPGVYTARYLGEDTPQSVKNASLIERLTGVPDEKRTARFVCVTAAAMPDGEVFTTRGVIEGRIAHQIKGDNGFGYDPIFYVPELGCTTAQISEEEKNRISHRGKALEAMKKELRKRM